MTFKKIQQKGFTLVELLVVIAIIGILSSVVLGTVNGVIAKSKDAVIKSNLAGIYTQAEIIYDDNESYQKVCGHNTTQDENVASLLAAIESLAGDESDDVRCQHYAHAYTSSTGWAVSAPLRNSDTHWCIDFLGNSHEVASAISTYEGGIGAVIDCPDEV